MLRNPNRLYDDLAWLWPLWGAPGEYAPYCDNVTRLIRQHAKREVKTLLNICCGGGKNIYNLKQEFSVTGLDLTPAARVAHLAAKGYHYGSHFLPHDAAAVEKAGVNFQQQLAAAIDANGSYKAGAVEVSTGVYAVTVIRESDHTAFTPSLAVAPAPTLVNEGISGTTRVAWVQQINLDDGSVTGDKWTVELNGQLGVEKVTISAEAVDPSDIRMLEDLVLAALSDAHARLKDRLRDEMAQATGIAGLPPGLFGA